MIKRYETFTVLIANITRSLRKIKTEEMAKWNLKSHHLSCIFYLYEHKSLTLKELADVSGEDKANLSRSIEILETMELVEPEKSKSRRYKNRLILTEKGVAVGKGIYDRVEEILREVSNDLSEEDREIMYRSLNTVDRNLQKISDEYRI